MGQVLKPKQMIIDAKSTENEKYCDIDCELVSLQLKFRFCVCVFCEECVCLRNGLKQRESRRWGCFRVGGGGCEPAQNRFASSRVEPPSANTHRHQQVLFATLDKRDSCPNYCCTDSKYARTVSSDSSFNNNNNNL